MKRRNRKPKAPAKKQPVRPCGDEEMNRVVGGLSTVEYVIIL